MLLKTSDDGPGLAGPKLADLGHSLLNVSFCFSNLARPIFWKRGQQVCKTLKLHAWCKVCQKHQSLTILADWNRFYFIDDVSLWINFRFLDVFYTLWAKVGHFLVIAFFLGMKTSKVFLSVV